MSNSEQSMLRRVYLWARDQFAPESGLEREEWFLRRAIVRTKIKLEDTEWTKWGSPVYWDEYSQLQEKLERQKARLAYLVERRNNDKKC